MRLLLVEDDSLLGGGLRAVLARSGFAVTWVRDGQAALDLLEVEDFVAVVLDIGLPHVGGKEVLRRLRAEGRSIPVLILTARDSTSEKVHSLDNGADDYLVKTADMEELTARLRALVRRAGRSGGVLRVGDIVLQLDQRSVSRNGVPVNLSRREFDLLRALMEGAGRVLSRTQLEQSIYQGSQRVESNAVEVHIHNLRHKLGSEMFRTVRGIGYSLVRPEAVTRE